MEGSILYTSDENQKRVRLTYTIIFSPLTLSRFWRWGLAKALACSSFPFMCPFQRLILTWNMRHRIFSLKKKKRTGKGMNALLEIRTGAYFYMHVISFVLKAPLSYTWSREQVAVNWVLREGTLHMLGRHCFLHSCFPCSRTEPPSIESKGSGLA